MKFEEIFEFPYEREAFIFLKDKLNLTEEEYLKKGFIERRELTNAYKIAKKLGVSNNKELKKLYKDTNMFNKDGIYDLGEATLIIYDANLLLNYGKKKLSLNDTIDEFILRGNDEISNIGYRLNEIANNDKLDLMNSLKQVLNKYSKI